ncbi:tryptophan synthase subunit alpha [Bacillus solimangrovi]|uniref:tryptophan synthase subunit alpha n=1 Tax=Bacillus solimangrovi TaxID=1305675 RepID=UPI000A96A679|nr:tryptophan synthase subunit alpha [Bacillus solimangrovi]
METSFQQRLVKQNNLFIPFIMAGDPSEEATVDLAVMLQEEGADILELGVPYSDPLADGPVIQQSAKRALSGGMNIRRAIELVPKMRQKGVKIPIVLFTYYNPVLQLEKDFFFALLQQNEVDGLLIPDLPHEESEEMRQDCKDNGIELISLVAPTSQKRIERIASEARGFVYCVSSLGVTGERKALDPRVYDFLEQVRHHSNVPVAVGFGISSYAQIEELSPHCDGIIIGSAIVRKIEEQAANLKSETNRQTGVQAVKEAVQNMLKHPQNT